MWKTLKLESDDWDEIEFVEGRVEQIRFDECGLVRTILIIFVYVWTILRIHIKCRGQRIILTTKH